MRELYHIHIRLDWAWLSHIGESSGWLSVHFIRAYTPSCCPLCLHFHYWMTGWLKIGGKLIIRFCMSSATSHPHFRWNTWVQHTAYTSYTIIISKIHSTSESIIHKCHQLLKRTSSSPPCRFLPTESTRSGSKCCCAWCMFSIHAWMHANRWKKHAHVYVYIYIRM